MPRSRSVDAVHGLALSAFGALPVGVRRRIVRVVAPMHTVGAIAVVTDGEGRVLLVRQRYRSHWGLPGGLLQRGEAPAAACVREVREETGLSVRLLGEPVVVVDPVPRRVDVVFRAECVAGAAHAASVEITEVRWFAPDSLPLVQDETAEGLAALERAGVWPPAPS